MFKSYSLKGCQFECKLINSYQSVGCIPWDYPKPPSLGDEGSIPICNSKPPQGGKIADSTLARFNDYMDSKESGDNCDCPADCYQEVRFETQVSISTNNQLELEKQFWWLDQITKVSKLSLNLDDLCDESIGEKSQKSTERVMRHWQFTRSPLVYWTQKMVKEATTERWGKQWTVA